MTSILDSMMKTARGFFPENVGEYIALQLARKLDDTDRVLSYVWVIDRYPMDVIVEAFKRTIDAPQDGEKTPAAMFDRELRSLTTQDPNDEQ